MINAERVTEIFLNCLFKKDEIINGQPIVEPIWVQGIMHTFGLHPERVQENLEEIKTFISELPEKFKEGWSFLNMCMTKDDDQWTGLHEVCEQLLVLGIAIKKIEYCMPKEVWTMLPGGMPYIKVLTDKGEQQ